MKVDKALRNAVRRNYEGLSDSKTFCLLFNEKTIEEVIPLIQMGLAVYLDKPIVILAPTGSVIPANLRAMATAIEEFDPNDEASLHRRPSSVSTATGRCESRTPVRPLVKETTGWRVSSKACD